MNIQVMVVDDSAVVRQVVTEILNKAPDINVYKAAANPLIAQKFMQQQWPDVIILDIEMPGMDGLSFLRKIMAEKPTPVIICSSLAQKGCQLSLEAMACGAIDIITKPDLRLKSFLEGQQHTFWESVRIAAKSRPLVRAKARPLQTASTDLLALSHTTDQIIAVGTSTGGTQALEYILGQLPAMSPAMAIVQHMPEKFTSAFAERLNKISAMEVREAKSGERLLPGVALIAPGGHHLEIKRSGAQYLSHVFRAPPVNRHCPSVDVLFHSVAKAAGKNATGVIMTGMGADGARGLLQMRKNGAATLAQDEASSVVYGMAKEAEKLNAVSEFASLDELPQKLLSLVTRV